MSLFGQRKVIPPKVAVELSSNEKLVGIALQHEGEARKLAAFIQKKGYLPVAFNLVAGGCSLPDGDLVCVISDQPNVFELLRMCDGLNAVFDTVQKYQLSPWAELADAIVYRPLNFDTLSLE